MEDREFAENGHSGEALRESEERYRNVYNTAPLAFVIWNRDCRITDWNDHARKIFGWSQEEAVGKNFFTFLIPQRAESGVKQVVENLLRGEIEPDVVNENMTKSGEIITCQWNNSVLRDREGNIIGGMSLALDITDKKRAEQERAELETKLRHSQKLEAVGQLAGGIAHDFNNILTAILGNAELAISQLRKAPPAEKSSLLQKIRHIEQSALRAADLTKQLLAFSRNQVTEPEILDLNKTLYEAEKMLRRLITESIRLTTFLAPDLWSVYADAGQIYQVIVNLVVNARDAMSVGGELTIETANVMLDSSYVSRHPDAHPGPHVMLTVSDTGSGMDGEIIQHIFEPFFTTKMAGHGTGMGLATVYGIVRQTGGHIAVSSAPGRGSTFTVYMPAVQDLGRMEHIQHPEEETRRGRETILVCEDDRDVLQLAVHILRDAGYTVLGAGNGAHALRIAAEHAGTIALLVTDVVMPEMNGKQLAESLSTRIPGLRTLFISGYTADIIASHGVTDEDTEFLGKPFKRQRLLRRVREVLDRAK
jgi:two-component system cell cycle sensor histidine kinase/response regulator CckA